MPGGLEAIAMAALQELQGSRDETKEAVGERWPSLGEDKEVIPPPDRVPRPSSTQEATGDLAEIKEEIVKMGVATEAFHRGPSSPAVVSSTSQEDEDEKQVPVNGHGRDKCAARVVSFQSTESASDAAPEQQPDVADQVLAILKSVEPLEPEKPPTFKQLYPRKEFPSKSKPSAKKPQVKSMPLKKPLLQQSPTTMESSLFVRNVAVPLAELSTYQCATDANSTSLSSEDTEQFIANILADPESFLINSEPLFSRCLNKTIDRSEIVADGVKPNDVLCGRGGETNHHTGNIQYRKLVKAYRALYVQSTRRIKPKIAQCIVYAVRQVGGRFLKRVEGDNSVGEKDSDDGNLSSNNAPWRDVGNVKAREKTSQALREGAPDLRTSNGPSSIQHEPSSTSPSAVPSVPASVLGDGVLESPSPPFVTGSTSRQGYGDPVQSHVAHPKAIDGKGLQSAAMAHHNASLPGKYSLTNHPLFPTLSPFQQHQIMLEELHVAREAAALQQYHYHRQQFGNGGHSYPGYGRGFHGEYEMGATMDDKAIEKMHEEMKMSLDSNDDLAFRGDSLPPHGVQSHLNHLKRRAEAAALEMQQAVIEKGNDDQASSNTCRGPRLKRLKLRRQLEA